jgi:dihydrofolate reductase
MRTNIVRSQTIPHWFDITTARISLSFPAGRYFSVKELSWCAPEDSPVRRQQQIQQQKEQYNGPTSTTNNKGHNNEILKLPIDHFGIVAAACSPTTNSSSKNNNSSGTVIGINGKLPWEYLPTDRVIFERLTRNRILIVGRRTLLEERNGNLDHIRHAKYCIVVSKSIPSLDTIEPAAPPVLLDKDKNEDDDDDDDDDRCILKLARSFDDAIELARELSITMNNEMNDNEKYKKIDHQENDNDNDNKQIPSLLSSSYNIQCWVAGGEKIYEEALKHGSASELHLSVLDMEIDLTSTAITNVTRFPSKYRWDHNYEKISETRLPFSLPTEEMRNEPSFNYRIYKRIIRQK